MCKLEKIILSLEKVKILRKLSPTLRWGEVRWWGGHKGEKLTWSWKLKLQLSYGLSQCLSAYHPPPMSFFHVVHNTNTTKRWDVSTANTNFTSVRFLKIFRYFNISAAPPTTPNQLNDKCKYDLVHKQTLTLDIIYVVILY